jgi:hypothetical protein
VVPYRVLQYVPLGKVLVQAGVAHWMRTVVRASVP